MKKLFYCLISFICVMMCGCGNTQGKGAAASKLDGKKALVLYYSQTGATQAVAEELAAATGADIEALSVTVPYDGTYDETIMRCLQERQEGTTPTLNAIKAQIADYDVVFLGYPIWFGTYAPPIMALVKEQDFAGKTVVPFCTFGSGGLEASAADLKAALPKAEIAEGYGVRNARVAAVPDEVAYFLVSNGYVEGAVEALPEYSAPQPVDEALTAIFDEACGDYMFPLGTPIAAGQRTTPTGTDYRYVAESKGADGAPTTAIIYVTVPANGEKAFFTRVAR